MNRLTSGVIGRKDEIRAAVGDICEQLLALRGSIQACGDSNELGQARVRESGKETGEEREVLAQHGRRKGKERKENGRGSHGCVKVRAEVVEGVVRVESKRNGGKRVAVRRRKVGYIGRDRSQERDREEVER